MRDPEKILADDPGSVVFSRYAEQLAREGQIGQAVDVLKRGIQANPFHAPGYSLLAELLFQLESEEAAVENIVSALRLDPQMPRDLFRLGTHYLDRDPSKALPLLKAACAYAPESGELASSFESARLRVESSGSGEDTPAEAKDHHPIENALTVDGAGFQGFGELEDASLPEDDFQKLFRKPSAPANQEDQDFLALMGEQGGGTIDEELDSLFQSLESNAGRATLPLEHEPEERAFDTVSVSAKAADPGHAPDLKPVVPEAGGEEADEDKDVEPPAYERPFNERPLDTLNEDDLSSDEAISQEFYDTQLVEEVEEKKDFFNAITEYGDEKAEDDLDTLFETLAKDRNLEVPLPELEESELEGADAERKDSDVGSEPGPEELPSGGLDEVAGEVLPEGYGIVDLEKEAEAGSVLEITEEEEYDLARFGFDSTPAEDLPVLSEAERTELMTLTTPRDGETGEKEAEDGPGLGDLSLEDLEKPEESGADEQTVESTGGRNEDSSSPSGTPVSAAPVEEIEAEDFAGDGIDYSDILSAWKLPGEENTPPMAVAPELLSISDILENLAESSSGSSGEIPPSSGLLLDEPEIPVTGESEIEDGGEPGFPEPEIPATNTLTSSEQEENAPLREKDDEGAPALSGGGTGEFALPMMDGLFDMGNPFHPLTEEQAALIDDFISGKEPEPEPGFPESLLSVQNPPDREEPVAVPILSGEDGYSAAKPDLRGFAPEPENPVESEDSELPKEPEEYYPVSAGGEQFSPVSPEIDIPAAPVLIEEPSVTAGPVKTAAKAGREESLDDLISLYRDMLEKPATPAPRMVRAITPPPDPVSPPAAGPNPNPVREMEPKIRNASKPLGNYTATMAEIYVSQGLITRAMEIYAVLAEDNPENGQYRLRLAELKRMHEQQSDIS